MDDWRKWQLILEEETGWFGKPIQTRDGGEKMPTEMFMHFFKIIL
jgi:hypothetical protein